MFWLYLYFPRLQLDSMIMPANNSDAQSGTEESAQQALEAVVDPHSHQLVQLSDTAIKEGLQVGMGLASAAALVEKLQVYAYQSQLEQDALEHLAEQLYSLNGDISLDPPKGLGLRLDTMGQLYQDLDNYWQQLQTQLAPLPLRYHFASATTLLAAKLLARAKTDQLLTHEQSAQRLQALPLACCDFPDKQLSHFERLGLQTVGELEALPRSELIERLDPASQVYLAQLQGKLPLNLPGYQAPEQFQRHCELSYEIKQSPQLLKILEPLLKQLEQHLRQRQLGAPRMQLSLIFREQPEQTLQIHAPAGQNSAAQWLKLFALRLERHPLAAPVYRLSLSLCHAQTLAGDKADLFNQQHAAIPASTLVAQLRTRLGDASLTGIDRFDDLRPERASVPHPGDLAPASALIAEQVLRPSLLLPSPQPLKHPITLQQGPERLVAGWWDQQPIERDYFIALSGDGQYLWVFRTPQQQWFVHGYFS
ncbi:Y-family DNA polymerase [Aliagarivorans taiwanensis]|uniref:Y-family DNA polymerase n=1 Tax=Aliagarivorans taiwanensis TaxID=561966 RepID=UPI000422989F|nr:DNA polymerase Y family protein [Aliagarivorans taiwanensis]